MIKCYVSNIPIHRVEKKINELSTYLHNTIKQTIFYSKENGMFIEENGVVHYIEPTLNETYEHITYLSHIFIVQRHQLTKVKVMSQLPLEYILQKNTIFEYKINDKSKLKLIIHGIYVNTEIKIIDFYFECPANNFHLDNLFFQEEINWFLSLLS